MKGKAYFTSESKFIDFSNGETITAGELSARTGYSVGEYALSKDETKSLFMAMMTFYIARGDKFWESNV